MPTRFGNPRMEQVEAEYPMSMFFKHEAVDDNELTLVLVPPSTAGNLQAIT